MSSRIAQWTLDVHDVGLMAEFWSRALGYRVDKGDDGCAKLYPPDGAPPEALTVWLQRTTAAKIGKNRGHPDLTVDDRDVSAEVDRLVALGARHLDIGQPESAPFVVLADPEGNEFCLLRRAVRSA